MSIRSQASANPTLTNYATGLAQDLESALAEFIAPTVEVPSTIGQYKQFNDKNAFAVYETARAMSGEATMIEFSAEDAFYNAKPQALAIPVDDAERDAADAADPIQLDESKVKTLVTNCVVSREVKVVKKTIGAISAEAGLGVWSDPSVDPIVEIDSLIEAITTNAGMMCNRLALGLSAWKVLRHHPKVLARQPGAQLIGLTTAQLAAMLLNPGIEIKIGILSKDITKVGKTANKQNIVGDNVLVFLGSAAPTQYDPSFAKTFMGKRGGVTSVNTYRAEAKESDVHRVNWSEDIQVTSTLCGKKITIS